jgi:YVTN family beta-propeller protein
MAEGDRVGRALRFSTLGPLRVTAGSDELPLGGRQQRAILAVLVINAPTAVSVALIAEEIWPGQVPAGYVGTIQTYIHHLRTVLEPDHRGGTWRVITTANGGYRLTVDGDTVDATTFERLAASGQAALAAGEVTLARKELTRALALWRGEVLADIADYPFVEPYAARLEEIRLTAREAEVDARLALGEHAALVADLDELVSRYPLREQLQGQRMLALYRSGRQADALAAYRGVHRMLADELGTAPGPQLQALHAAMLAQDPATGVPAATRRCGGQSAAPGPPARSAQPPSPPRHRVLAGAVAGLLGCGASVAFYGATHRTASHPPPVLANSVAILSPDGKLSDPVPVGPGPSAMAYGAGTVWVVSGTDGRVIRVDAATRRVTETIPVGRTPDAIALTTSDAWVANSGDGTVSRINISTNQVVGTTPVGSQPSAIAVGPSGVWVANSQDDSIQRIDPVTGVAGTPIPVGGRPEAIAVDARSVWVANGADGTVTRVDAATGQPVQGPIGVGSDPAALSATSDAVWVANVDDQSIDRLEVRTGRVTARIGVGDGPDTLAVTGENLWVGNGYDGTISEVDTATNTVRRRFTIGAAPLVMAVVGSSVWLASGPLADPAHTGGTLTVAGAGVPGTAVGIDPSDEYLQATTLRAERLVYDGLVSYHVAGGSAGLTIVPDLATAVPRPSDGGRTYAFTLRSGLRFSDGSPVHASDVRRGVLRSLTAATYPGGPATTVGIIGAEHCAPGRSCDLSRGVVVNDATGGIVFHLYKPQPDFLFKLTYFGAATVPRAPATTSSTPLPGTGPYRISSYVQGKAFVLTRNPYFHQWSFAAQPAGYPDTIRFLALPDTSAAIAAVRSGSADVLRLANAGGEPVSRTAIDQLRQQIPAQLHTENPFALDWLYFNNRAPPFNDVRVRQAVNNAIDRRVLADLFGGASLAVPTCQMLPAEFPGYAPYCPYSTGAPDAPYDGPDLARAQNLVAASGTRGAAVTLVGMDAPLAHATNTYLVGVLRSLGYAATLRELSRDAYFGELNGPTADWQMIQATGWLADYPLASDFYLNLFSCTASIAPGIVASRKCDPTLDSVAETAAAAEGSDPATARAMWSEVDRAFTSDAYILPLVNELEDTLVSTRVGNYQSSPELGPLLSQLWVR